MDNNIYTTITSWHSNGAIDVMPRILDNIKNGKRDGLDMKAYNKKDIISILEFICKFDKATMIKFMQDKFFIAVDKFGRPLCRYVENGKIIKNDYLS